MNSRLVIRLGLTCNNYCKFCIFDRKNEHYPDRTNTEIKRILKNNKNYRSVVFTGGEPCLREDLPSLVHFAKALRFNEIQIQSNGRLFTYRDLCKGLIDAGATEFAVALHGHNAQIHDGLTNADGSFNQTVKGIVNLKELGQYVITNSVITRLNYKHLTSLAQLLINLDIPHFQFSFVHIIGQAWANKKDIVIKKSKVIPYLVKAIKLGSERNKRVTTEAIPYCLLKEYERCVVEEAIPSTTVFELDAKIPDLRKHRINDKKTKSSKCIKCSYNHSCEGPWKEYPQLFGWQEFKAIG